MKKLLFVLSALFLIGCVEGGGSPAALSSIPGGQILPGADPVFTMRVYGDDDTFACVFYTNFGDPDQVESPTMLQTFISLPPVKEFSVQGRNTVGNCAHISGTGVLTVQILVNGVLQETKTSLGFGTSAFWNIGIQ